MSRLVVTGHDAGGASVVVSDQVLDGFTPVSGLTVVPVWSNEPPRTMGEERADELVPTVGSIRITTFSLAPGANGAYHRFVADHLGSYADPQRPGMHVTPTQDYVTVLVGSVVLELDGESVLLACGDVVVQNGTMHRWSNPGDTTTTILVVMAGLGSRA